MNIYCILDANGNITTLFGGPQNAPVPTGYTVMQDTDSRYQAYLLVQAQKTQIAYLFGQYQSAISQPVSYTSKAGVTKTYQADPTSISNLQASIAGYTPLGATPAGFYWVAADNTQVPFTLADLQGLAAAMMAQGWTAFQRLQTDKGAVNAATTVAQAQAVVW